MKTKIKYTYQDEQKEEFFSSTAKALVTAYQLSMLSQVTSVVIVSPDGKETKLK